MTTRLAAPWRAIGAPTKAMMMSPMPKLLQRRRRSSSSLVALASASASSTPTSPSRPRRRVAVVGGGVIGLSTALRLAEEAKKEKFGGGGGSGSGSGGSGSDDGLSVSVFARGFFGPDTTSSGAGGLWEPYKLGDTPSELVNRWSAETLEFLLARARGEEEGEGNEGGGEEGGKGGGEEGESSPGVIEGPVLQYWTQPAPEDPAWAPVAPGFRRLSRPELEAAFEVAKRGAEENRMRMAAAAAEEEEEGEEQQQRQHLLPSFALEAPAIVDGWTFSSAAAQPSRYLSWLARRAERAGVELVARELESLDELLTFDDDCGEKSGAAAAAAAADAGEGGRASSSSSSSSLPRFDAIVNCAGLAGGDLSRDDATPPTPVRGQVARLRPPLPPPSSPLSSSSSSSSSSADDKKNAAPVPPLPLGGAAGLFLDEETYLIRNVDFVVAGGTGQAGDADAAPRASDRASILARTRLLDPALVAARSDGGGGGAGAGGGQQREEDWAGLRPLRSPVRLEARWVEVKEEEKEEKEGKKKDCEKSSSSPASSSSVLVVSNYGHGGSGFTLHWGCAGDAAALVLEGLKKKEHK